MLKTIYGVIVLSLAIFLVSLIHQTEAEVREDFWKTVKEKEERTQEAWNRFDEVFFDLLSYS